MPSRSVVSFVGTHDPDFTRTSILAAGLARHGFVVTQSVLPCWGSTTERIAAARRGMRNPGLLWRLARAYWRVLHALRAQDPRPDALVLGHPGQLDAIVLRALAPRIPLVLDAFIAIDETLADRGLAAATSLSRRLARQLDRLAMRAADLVIVDTAAHGRRYATAYGLDLARSVVVPVGAHEPGGVEIGGLGLAGRAPPLPDPQPLTPGPRTLSVLYFGGFIPLHGVPVILEAARRLTPDEGIHLELVGDGQQADDAEQFLARHSLPHVRLTRTWMSEEDLIERYVGPAEVCLGIFAAAPKTMDVVPAKVYLSLACGRAVLTADTPAVREEIFARAGEAAPVAVCAPGDPDALVAALRGLRDDADRRLGIAATGRRLYETHFRPEPVVEPLVTAIRDLPER